ncbi:ATP-dependent sacrificial sulfur transferase LarE [Pirellulaceae bacterium]|nr:ATP-dependent sacrificial sulfur transferase LarE [Pirellulaceae bacterium]
MNDDINPSSDKSQNDCVIENADKLVERISKFNSVIVAYSGGVDSCVVAQAAFKALGAEKAIAVIAISPSLARRELKIAEKGAAKIGMELRCVHTNEIENPEYVANDGRRCFHCKTELYRNLRVFAETSDFETILNGTNLDDFSDYRPGLEAAEQFTVRSPLADCKFTKSDVRDIARHWELPVWNKPASPCLASRIAYNESVEPAKLQMIEAAEDWLLEKGFIEMRVRYHAGDLAKVELPEHDLRKMLDGELRKELTSTLKKIGFRHVTLDLEGFRSGSMNVGLPLVQIDAT